MGEFVLKNAWLESTRATPFYLNFGQHPITPKTNGKLASQVLQAKDLVSKMHENLREARDKRKREQNRQKSYADKKRQETNYEVGQKLLLSTRDLRLKQLGAKKILPR
jgi:uncharacterized protein YjaZ